MNKEELKNFVKDVRLEKELEDLAFELIDNAQDVNAILLNSVADIIELQAKFDADVADILEEEAEEYKTLAEELGELDEEEVAERMEAMKQHQEELLAKLNETLKKNGVEVTGGMQVPSTPAPIPAAPIADQLTPPAQNVEQTADNTTTAPNDQEQIAKLKQELQSVTDPAQQA